MAVLLAELAKVASIFGLSWFSFWSAIPVGLALDLSPIVIIVTTTLSYISGVLLVTLPGERVRAWALRRFGKQAKRQANKDTLIQRIWARYGVIGFGLLAPMTIGAQLGAILGIALNIPKGRLLLWMAVGVLLWAIGLTMLALAGIESLAIIFQG
jgi:hypothetical protein